MPVYNKPCCNHLNLYTHVRSNTRNTYKAKSYRPQNIEELVCGQNHGYSKSKIKNAGFNLGFFLRTKKERDFTKLGQKGALHFSDDIIAI